MSRLIKPFRGILQASRGDLNRAGTGSMGEDVLFAPADEVETGARPAGKRSRPPPSSRPALARKPALQLGLSACR